MKLLDPSPQLTAKLTLEMNQSYQTILGCLFALYEVKLQSTIAMVR